MSTCSQIRRKKNQQRADEIRKAAEKSGEVIREAYVNIQVQSRKVSVLTSASLRPAAPSQMFFTYNTALQPPYPILLDTNFLSHTIRAKLPLLESLMDCLSATVRPMITSCVMAELEKLGPKYRYVRRAEETKRMFPIIKDVGLTSIAQISSANCKRREMGTSMC